MSEEEMGRKGKVEIKPVRKRISWSHGSATVTIPAGMRDAMGIRPRERTEVEISLLNDKSGVLIRLVKVPRHQHAK